MREQAPTDTTEVAKRMMCAHLKPGDHAVDATCGNGWDTRAMAEAVGAEGRVFAFDVQPDAIAATRNMLAEHHCLDRVKLLQVSHVHLAEHLPGKMQAVMFNLGYLPGGDKAIATQTEDTLKAIQVAYECLADQGLLSVVVYPGHEEGAREAAAIDAWIKDQLDAKVFCYRPLNSRAPFAWFVQKKDAPN